MEASSTTHTLMSVQAGRARGYVRRYFLPFRSVPSLVHLSHSYASLHIWCLAIHRFTVGLCHVSPCLPRLMLCLDVNEVNPGPSDREVGHRKG